MSDTHVIDYGPGDEIVCVQSMEGAPGYDPSLFNPQVGEVFVCQTMGDLHEVSCDHCKTTIWITLKDQDQGDVFGACSFRKVQKVDLAAWLKATRKVPEPA